MNRFVAMVMVMALSVPASAVAQSTTDLWRDVAARIEVGTEVNVRLRDGQRLRATLLDAREQTLVLQPRTRVPVAVQEVAYTDIAALERRTPGGMHPGKAVAIGVASGAGAILTVFAILAAVYAD